MKRLLAICLTIALLLGTMVIPATSYAADTTGVVHSGWLRLRASASFDAATISSYYTGTVVTILDTVGGWYHVRTPDGRTGYMYSAYVTVGGSSSSSGSSGTGTATVWSSNGYGVRMRSGPGTGYSILAVYSVGTKVTVLERGTNWSKIQVGSLVGYMMNEFLTGNTTTPPTVDSKGNATIWSANGYGVRLRTGPGTGYSIIGVYSVGTTVEILQKGAAGGWDYIRVGSRTGYMMNEFLIYYGSTEVTKVTLNYVTPVVGTYLEVLSITPSAATVNYQWAVDGVTISGETTSRLFVSSGYESRTITLTVTGKGSYTGSASVTTNAVIMPTAVTADLNIYDPVIGDVLKPVNIDPEGAAYSCRWVVTRSNGKIDTYATLTYTADKEGDIIDLYIAGKAPYKTDESYVGSTAQVSKTGVVVRAAIENQTSGIGTNVGDKLVATYEPARATVRCDWYVTDNAVPGYNKLVASNAITYTVLANHIPSTGGPYNIKLVVTGTGRYANSSQENQVGSVTTWPTLKTIAIVNDTNPGKAIKAGDTISVGTLKDTSGNNVISYASYSWYVGTDTTSVGTEVSYVVQDEDVGQKIKVVAEGDYSSCAGTISTSTANVNGVIHNITLNIYDPNLGNRLLVDFNPAGASKYVTYEWFRGTSDSDMKSTGIKTTFYDITAADKDKLIKVVVKGTGYYAGSQADDCTGGFITFTATEFANYSATLEDEADSLVEPSVDGTVTTDETSPAGETPTTDGSVPTGETPTTDGSIPTGETPATDESLSTEESNQSEQSSTEGETIPITGASLQATNTSANLDQAEPEAPTVTLSRNDDVITATVSATVGSVQYTWYLDGEVVVQADAVKSNTYTVQPGDVGKRLRVDALIDNSTLVSARIEIK